MDLSDIVNYDDFTFALCAFLDEFKRSNSKYDMIKLPPESDSASKENICILAAACHKLANDNKIDVPEWVHDEKYKMPHPVFAFNTKNKEYQEFLLKDTPSEFASKNIFHGSNAIDRV